MTTPAGESRGEGWGTPPAGERLNRFLARRGVASRRGADAVIADGRVTVNGRTASLGAVVQPDIDAVSVDGKPLPAAQVMETLVLNKPVGVVSTRHDPQGRRTVMQLVPEVPGLVPVGRLDIDSRGLLLLTTDGELAHRLTHPRFGITKHYRATVSGPITPAHLHRLRRGMKLEDGPARALSARRTASRAVDLVMGEGRKREVRRLCAAVGLELVDLQRIGIGPLPLGDLADGRARPLDRDELEGLRAAVGLGAGATSSAAPPPHRRRPATSASGEPSREHLRTRPRAGPGGAKPIRKRGSPASTEPAGRRNARPRRSP